MTAAAELTPIEAVVLLSVQTGRGRNAVAIAQDTGIALAVIERVADDLAVRGLMNSVRIFGPPNYSHTRDGQRAVAALTD